MSNFVGSRILGLAAQRTGERGADYRVRALYCLIGRILVAAAYREEF